MNNDYYEYFIERLREVIEKNNNKNPSYWINKVKDQPHVYSVDKLDGFSSTQREHGKEIFNEFIKDFKAHLLSDAPFKLVYKNYFPNSLIMGISDYLYNSYFRDDYLPRKNLNPTLEQFTKVLKCFEEVISTTFLLSLEVPRDMKDINPNYFIKAIFSLDNKKYYENLKEQEFHEVAKGELDQLYNHFYNEKDPLIKESLIIYLKNRETTLEKFPNVQLQILEQVKAIVHSDYWSEISLYFPNLKKKDLNKEKTVFNTNINPVYFIEINKDYIMNASPTIITNADFSNMISLVTKSIVLNKPDNIDFIEVSEINNRIKLFVSGVDLNQDKVHKIGDLFELMINEYNSDKIVKYSNYYTIKNDSIKEANKDYLNKAAETYWLNLELEKNNLIKRKNKI